MFYLICLFALSLTSSLHAMMQSDMKPNTVQTASENSGMQKHDKNIDSLGMQDVQRATTISLNKENAQRIIPESPLGMLIQSNDVDAIQSKCEGSWWYKYFISEQDNQRCMVFGLLYGASLKSEQSGKVVDYFVDKIKKNHESKAAFFAEVDDEVIEGAVLNCHRKLLSLLMEKFPHKVKKVFNFQKTPPECHTRIIDTFRIYLPAYSYIDPEVVELFNQYQFDEQLIAALLPMAQLGLMNGKIDVNKLDEKRALDNDSLHKEVRQMLQVIDGVFDTFLRDIAKRLLTSYLRVGLQEEDKVVKSEL